MAENDPAGVNATERDIFKDAQYVIDELSRGEAVSAEVAVKAKPYVEALAKALPGKDIKTCELALFDLMAVIAPVTISSLRHTEDTGTRRTWVFSRKRPSKNGDVEVKVGEADLFSDALVLASIVFLILAMASTLVLVLCSQADLVVAVNKFLAIFHQAPDKAATVPVPDKMVVDARKALSEAVGNPAGNLVAAVKVIQTVLFGGLGACVYLLRALHKHIHDRTFDPRFKPEYVNRIVLGTIGGGVVTMLVQNSGASFLPTDIGYAAVAFLIGYNTDLLFSLIERVSLAVFPKVPDPPAPTPTPITPPKDRPGDPNT